MEFKLTKVSGVDDAIISLFVSKRHFDPEECDRVRDLIYTCSDRKGALTIDADYPRVKEVEVVQWLKKVCKYGLQLGYKRSHETLLRFIDFTIETRGLHKAAMGDLDAHAPRMNNRIIRASSRLASFDSGEKSDYYKGKILTIGEAMGENIPHLFVKVKEAEGDVIKSADTYRFNGFGFVREDCWDDQDVQRGTYMLSIPSDAIWKCDFVGLKHIYAMRNKFTHAHPELQEGMEQLADQIEKALPIVGMGIRHEWVGDKWVHVDKVCFSEAESEA